MKARIVQSPNFKKTAKKLSKARKKLLDQQVLSIVENPNLGKEKKGDLVGIFVHKFRLQNQLYLLSYRLGGEDEIQLLTLGLHENYYRDLKKYIK